MIHQGDVYWIDLGQPIGSEPAYIHPYVVIQNDVLNRSQIRTVIVCALTSRRREYQMQEYEFTLKFRLPDPTTDTDMYVDALYESGCDDAIIGTGTKGFIALDFIREAPSAYDALSSAIKDVKKAIPQAEVVEASPDFVGVTDVAKLLGCSRQNIQKLLSKSISNRPHAVYGGAQSIWHLLELLTWLIEYQNYPIDETLVEIARTTRSLNLVKQSERLDPEMQRKFHDLVSTSINTR